MTTARESHWKTLYFQSQEQLKTLNRQMSADPSPAGSLPDSELEHWLDRHALLAAELERTKETNRVLVEQNQALIREIDQLKAANIISGEELRLARATVEFAERVLSGKIQS